MSSGNTELPSLTAAQRLMPFVATVTIVALDQVVKAIVVATLPYAQPQEVLGDFLRFTFVQNPAIAFSIGRGLPEGLRRILFLILPAVVLVILVAYYLSDKDLGSGQRWLVAAVVGGGAGNYLDRLFRLGGVVDFVDVNFYGLLGFTRFPTFNVADATVVVCGTGLLISFLRAERRGAAAARRHKDDT